jgi:hypothetical protein
MSAAKARAWSVETELCAMAGTDTADAAVHALGLLDKSEKEKLVDTVIVEDWHRGGAETYICVFDLRGHCGRLHRFLFKSFVPDVISVGEALAAVAERRGLLVSADVLVPTVFGESSGTWLEQYVPLRLADVVRTLPLEEDGAPWLTDLMTYAVAVDPLGFAPIAPLADLRTDGVRVYPVDFGQDLGGRVASARLGKCQRAVMQWIERERPDATFAAWDALDKAVKQLAEDPVSDRPLPRQLPAQDSRGLE